MVDEADAAAPAMKKSSSRWRLLALAVFLVGSVVIAHTTGLTERLDVATIRGFMEAAGTLGFFAFLAAFALGELVHVPGLVFVGAASVAYGQTLGTLAAYVGALASLTLSFYVVRMIGGQPLEDVKRPLVRRILSGLDEHPMRTIMILRLFFWMAPALNYALAMSKVRYRDYLFGSALGLLIPIPLAVLFFDWLAGASILSWLGSLF